MRPNDEEDIESEYSADELSDFADDDFDDDSDDDLTDDYGSDLPDESDDDFADDLKDDLDDFDDRLPEEEPALAVSKEAAEDEVPEAVSADEEAVAEDAPVEATEASVVEEVAEPAPVDEFPEPAEAETAIPVVEETAEAVPVVEEAAPVAEEAATSAEEAVAVPVTKDPALEEEIAEDPSSDMTMEEIANDPASAVVMMDISEDAQTSESIQASKPRKEKKEKEKIGIKRKAVSKKPVKGKEEKANVFKFIVIFIVVVFIAVGAVAFMRTKLLTTQLEMAQKYMDEEKWDEAEATYRQALKIFHNSADAYLGLAEVSIGRGELTGAIQVLDEGIRVTRSTNLEKSKDVIIDQVFATYVLDSYLINILPGETAQLTMTNRSEDLGFDVTWACEDETIGTIDETGFIKALKNGTTKIIATVGNETWGYRDVTATLIVGVLTTYLEEEGCDYVSSPNNLTAPCFVYQQSNDGYRIYDGTLDIEQGNASYSLTKCVVSDPDPDGNVEYEIEYTITVPTKFGIITDSKEAKHAWYYNWVAKEMMLCDDYTGLVFSVQDLYGQEGLIYDSTVTWNDMDYHVTGTTESEWVNEEQWAITFSPLTSTTWAEAPAIGTFKLNITVPKEYQGLVLALDKKGITDYKDPEYDEDSEYDAADTFTDHFFFDPQEDGTVRRADEFYIIRLSDFAEHK